MDSVTPDPFGTVGTPTKPLYRVIVDFTGGNIVGENQSERYTLQYLVTDTNSGTQVVQVDNNIAGGATVSAGASGGVNSQIDVRWRAVWFERRNADRDMQQRQRVYIGRY